MLHKNSYGHLTPSPRELHYSDWMGFLRVIARPSKERILTIRCNVALSLRFLLASKESRIIYILTPTASLKNLGDHAQVIAIRSWFSQHFPQHHVVEVNKNEAIYGQWMLKRSVKEGDLIFLHSGGNLGDRGVWSERGRRLVINNFRTNKIVSLPQTIFFSDSAQGYRERAESQKIYNAHPLLTIMSRDQKSHAIARELFHNANHLLVPDFVNLLSLKFFGLDDRQPRVGSTLAIIRNDQESAFQGRGGGVIKNLVSGKVSITDTQTKLPLPSFARKFMVARFVRSIQGFEVVVTDRLHGLIFSILANRPTVVLGTRDHKLEASFEWFDANSAALFSRDVDEVPELLSKARSLESNRAIDFKAVYFDSLPAKLNTHKTE